MSTVADRIVSALEAYLDARLEVQLQRTEVGADGYGLGPSPAALREEIRTRNVLIAELDVAMEEE